MSGDVTITFPGGKRVDAQVGSHVVRTDQPTRAGGDDSAPSPFELFLASLATCAGIYVLGFCQARNIPTEGVRLTQRSRLDPQTRVLAEVEIDIEVPPAFPAQYHDALVRAAEQCAVKKAIQAQPAVRVRTVPRA